MLLLKNGDATIRVLDCLTGQLWDDIKRHDGHAVVFETVRDAHRSEKSANLKQLSRDFPSQIMWNKIE